MRRSLSAGTAGVVFLGAVFAVANAVDKKEPVELAAGGEVVVAESLLDTIAHGEATETKLESWGVPTNIVLASKDVDLAPVEEAPVEEAAPAEEEVPVAEAPAEEAPAEAPTEEAAVLEEAPVAEVPAPSAEPAPLPEATQEPAPVEPAPAPAVVEAPAPAVQETQAPAPAPAKVVETPAPAPTTQAPVLSPVNNQAKRNAVVSAALAAASVNAQTDCTMLATNSLRAAGINFHGWPMDYMALGSVTSNPQPGDLVIYASNGFGQQHIAVYIGNGQAVHGGWNGMGTSVFSVNLPTGSAPIFVSPSAYNG